MNFFKMLRPMRTKMLNCVALLLFLLPSVGVMGQCGEIFSISSFGCSSTFTPTKIGTELSYCWTLTHEDGITLTSTDPIASFEMPPQTTTMWTINLMIKNPEGDVIADCTQGFFVDCIFTGCFMATPRINCAQLLVNVNPVNLGGSGQYLICPGDGSDCFFTDFGNGAQDICYSNINTVETPEVTITILDFQTNEELCSETVTFPEEGIFVGKLCETTTISDLVNGGTLDIPTPLFPTFLMNGDDWPDVYLSGHLWVDQSFIFENINIFTGTNTEIDVQPGPNIFFSNLTLRNGTEVGPQEECVCIWRGINVVGVARLSTNTTEEQDRVKIHGALYATRAISPNIFTFFQPSVALRNVDLERNFIGFRGTDGRFRIRLSGTVFDGSGGLQTIDCNTLGQCPLVNDLDNPDSNANPDYPFQQNQGYAGILVDGIRFGEGIDGAFLNIPEVNEDGAINTFQNLAVGIVVDEANATIRSCEFRNIERYGYANNSGFGIRFIDGGEGGNHTLDQVGEGSNVNNFNRVEHGIFASSHSFETVANIFNNNMTNVQFGITITSPNDAPQGTVGNVANAEIRGNRITVNEDFENVLFQAPYGIGVFDENMDASDYLIRNNSVTADLNTPANSVGIWANGIKNPADKMRIHFNNDVNLIQGIDGIRVDNWHRADVYANDVDIFNPNLAFGIRIAGGNGCRVRCNDVEAIEENNTAQAVFITFSRASQLLENDLFSTNVGISVDGPCETSNITCNDMNAPMGTGLLYSNFNDGMGNFTTTGPQNNKANRWLTPGGNSFGVGAQHAGTFFSTLSSLYETQSNPPFLPPSVNALNPSWFTTTTGPAVACNFCNAFIADPDVAIDEIDEKIIADDLDNISEAIKYLLARGLFEKLSEHPELPNVHVGAQQFLDDNQDKAIGLFYQYQKALENLFKINPSTRLILDNNNLDIKTALAAIQNIDLQLANDPTNEPLQIDRFNQANIIDDKIAANKAIYEILKVQRLVGADDLLATLATIPATEDYEINEKMVSEMYVNVFVKGNTLTVSEWDFIENLAYTCGTIGGPAVFLARSMYSWKTGIPVSNPACEGENAGNLIQNSTNTIDDFGLFPNPNSGSFTLEVPTSYLNKPINIIVTDINGKVVKQQFSNIEKRMLNLDIGEYPDGIYFLKVFDNEFSIFTNKVILTK